MTSFVVVLFSLTIFFLLLLFMSALCFLVFEPQSEYTVRLNLCIKDCVNEMNSQKILTEII